MVFTKIYEWIEYFLPWFYNHKENTSQQLQDKDQIGNTKEMEMLLNAVKNKDEERVKSILDNCKDDNYQLLDRKFEKDTPLLIAIKDKNIAMVKMLLNAIPGTANEIVQGESMLLYALQEKHYFGEIFEELLKSADINQRVGSLKTTAFHRAVRRRNRNALERIIGKESLDFNVVDEDGKTALHLAAFNKETYYVYRIAYYAKHELQRKVDLNIKDRNNLMPDEYRNQSSELVKKIKDAQKNKEKLKAINEEYGPATSEFGNINSNINLSICNSPNTNVVINNIAYTKSLSEPSESEEHRGRIPEVNDFTQSENNRSTMKPLSSESNEYYVKTHEITSFNQNETNVYKNNNATNKLIQNYKPNDKPSNDNHCVIDVGSVSLTQDTNDMIMKKDLSLNDVGEMHPPFNQSKSNQSHINLPVRSSNDRQQFSSNFSQLHHEYQTSTRSIQYGDGESNSSQSFFPRDKTSLTSQSTPNYEKVQEQLPYKSAMNEKNLSSRPTAKEIANLTRARKKDESTAFFSENIEDLKIDWSEFIIKKGYINREYNIPISTEYLNVETSDEIKYKMYDINKFFGKK